MPTAIVAGKEDDVRAIGDEAAKNWAECAAKDGQLLDLLVKQCSGAIGARQTQTSGSDV